MRLWTCSECGLECFGPDKQQVNCFRCGQTQLRPLMEVTA